jgi:hypothetical protein
MSNFPHRDSRLLVIDSHSFALRINHASSKTIRQQVDKGGGAIGGFADILLWLRSNGAVRSC